MLDYADVEGDPNEPGGPGVHDRRPSSGHRLLFLEAPDGAKAKQRAGKNRVHLDLRPRVRTRDEELEWLVARGATVLADLRGVHGPGTGWIVLADPEGNQFCVLRSEAELPAD